MEFDSVAREILENFPESKLLAQLENEAPGLLESLGRLRDLTANAFVFDMPVERKVPNSSISGLLIRTSLPDLRGSSSDKLCIFVGGTPSAIWFANLHGYESSGSRKPEYCDPDGIKNHVSDLIKKCHDQKLLAPDRVSLLLWDNFAKANPA